METCGLKTSGSSSGWWWQFWLKIMTANRESSESILVLGEERSAIRWLFQFGRVDRNLLSFAAVKTVA
jgi:hypothetical protein